jgi:uncharacterized membrane protein
MNKVKQDRMISIDFLRGLAMVVMALDHVRHFFMGNEANPTDLSEATIPLFLTRWITHFCAPVFVFLAGTGAYISLKNGRPKEDVAHFLIMRGLLLIFLEITFIQFSWTFEVNFHYFTAQILWVLGWSMLALAGLLYLPSRMTLAIGVVLIAGHNLLDRVDTLELGFFGPIWAILHTPEVISPLPGINFQIIYPLLPWVGVMAVGFGFGEVMVLSGRPRKRVLFWIGFLTTLLFVILRFKNDYGDPGAWTVQKNWIYTVFSFLNCEKYPPSLLFLLMTLGPSILLLYLLEKRYIHPVNSVVILGKVPLFYYLLHIPLIHLIWLAFSSLEFHAGKLALTYLIWIGVVTFLLPLCYWFADFKRDNKNFWLSYL